jgi:hypothetical protein
MAALDSNSDRAVGGDDIVDLMLIHVHIFVYTVLVSIKKVWNIVTCWSIVYQCRVAQMHMRI